MTPEHKSPILRYEPRFDASFVNRENELRWLYEHVIAPRRRNSAIFVTGPPGIGKTALLNHFVATRRIQSTPVWLDLPPFDPVPATTEFVEQLYAQRLRDDLIVIIDGAELLSDNELQHFIGGLFNLKAVRSLLFASRRTPKLDRIDLLSLSSLTEIDTAQLIKAVLSSELLPKTLDEAVRLTQGNPLAVSMLGSFLKSGGQQAVLDLISGRLYDVSKTVALPETQIVASVTPKIVSATDALIEELKKQPDSIYDLSSRKFEELLAELLSDMGWEVELTPATRDGGKDILAYLDTDVGKLLCLVEAKKYRHDRKIGVDLVRTLYGTMFDHQANSAMLVTTSSFTSDAHEFQRRHEYQLALRDYGHIVQWIQRYKQKTI
jgi:restriction system protein